MSKPGHRVECAVHGDQRAAKVCQHLAGGVSCGYNHSRNNPDDPWPDAWCDGCAVVLEQERGWNERSEGVAGVTVVCSACYERIRSRNANVPFPVVAEQPTLDEARFQVLVKKATNFSRMCQEDVEATWDLSAVAHVELDFERGEVTFRSDTCVAAIADMQRLGTICLQTGQWQWAWSDDGQQSGSTLLARQMRMFGEVRGLTRLTQASWAAEEADGMQLAYLAAYLTDAETVLVAPAGQRLRYLVLDNLRAPAA